MFSVVSNLASLQLVDLKEIVYKLQDEKKTIYLKLNLKHYNMK